MNSQSPLPDKECLALPPTILVVHPREKRRKCTLEPLRGNADFPFWKFPRRGQQDLSGYVRLSLDGPLLSHADASCGLILLDATWRLVSRMEADYRDVPPRRLGPWVTAYPRTSKYFDEPSAGLASIEALYAGLVQMGRPRPERVLQDYHWKNEFLERNAALIAAADREFATPG